VSLRRFLHRRLKDTDLKEELNAHLAHEMDTNTQRGMSDEEARRRAYVKFGNPRSVREQVWRWNSIPWVENAWRDLRFALRSLAKTPGFTIIAILVIAVGIGANTAVFSVVNSVLLKPLSYPEPQSLMQILNVTPRGSFPGASVPKFNIWRQQTSIFQYVAGYDTGGSGLNLTGGKEPEQVQGIHVTADYFRMFGAPVILGRTFTAAEDSPHGGRVVVLSHALWKSRFGSNPKIVGSTISLDNQPYLVVGIIGPGFETYPAPGDLWLPYQFDLNSRDFAHYFTAVGKLKPGITVSMAQAQMRLAADQFRRTYPGSLRPNDSFGVASLQDSMVSDARSSLLVLLGAVGFVLLIACANVANLMLIRATARKRELATRSALGAGRGHIIRQLLTESLLLSFTGGLIGLIAGFAGVRLLLAVNLGNMPRIGERGAGVSLDGHVLLFTFVVSMVTGILFGLFPAITASRNNLVSTLNESNSRGSAGFRSSKLRSFLVISEMALALVLVIGATLLIRTFYTLQAVNPGFDTHHVLTLAMAVSGDRFQKTAGLAQVTHDGIDRLNAIPGVENSAAACCLPLQGGFGLPFDIVGRPKEVGPASGGGGINAVTYNYFESFKIPLLRGRSFTEHDDSAAPPVVIINDALARQYWPKGDPLKDRLLIGANVGPAFIDQPRQIIGVVGDIHEEGLNEDPGPAMYIPFAQQPDGITALNSRITPLFWIVRTRVEPHSVIKPVSDAIREASGGLPVAHIRSMDEIVVNSTSRQHFNMLLLTIFGISALLMAAIGIYGVMAYSVQQRTQEVGIRMALGAQASNIRNMVIRQGMILAIVGMVIGIGGAFWLTHFIAGFLFGVKAWDPLSFIVTPLLLCAIALLAVWIPARRATRVNPMTALRFE